MNKTLEQRFWEKVSKGDSDQCWEWLAYKTPKGYGRFQAWGRMRCAHRIAWRLTQGEIPESLCVLHKCDNPGCVNPNHLFLGTHADNVHDMIAKGRDNFQNPHKGSDNGKSKLTKEQVLEIRERYANEDISQGKLAEDYPVSRMGICYIVNRKSWGHI